MDDPAAVSLRRRAVFAALLTVLPQADARAAVAIWDRDYRHGRSQYDGLNTFARHVCGQFRQPGRHRELIQRLMEFFFAPEAALPADPGAHDAVAAPAADAVVPPPPAVDAAAPARDVMPAGAGPREPAPPTHVSTWLLVMRRLVAELQPHDRLAATTLMRATLQAAQSVGVDAVNRELLRLAVEGRYHDRLQRVAVEDVHVLLNFAYVQIAGAVGPVLADHVMSDAIVAVEGMPEALAFPPRRLL